MSQERQ
jgi:hypothetical protein